METNDLKYASKHINTDILAYEIISKHPSGKIMTVRPMKANLDKESGERLKKSFRLESSRGIVDNNLQVWKFKPNYSAPKEIIKLYKDNKWYNKNHEEFTLEQTPKHFFDFNL